MVLVLVRHAERLDYVKRREWMDAAERPWDTPITPHGHEQARRAGAAIKAHLDRLGLAQPSKVFSSPLTRCVETARGIRAGLGKEADLAIEIENRLVEAMSEDWYRSWAMKGRSDSTWGGPEGFRTGSGYPDGVLLRPEAHEPAINLLPTAADFAGWDLRGTHQTTFAPAFTISAPEDHDTVGQRLGEFALSCHAAAPDETIVLVSHGGPTGALYRYLTGKSCPKVGFVAISVLEATGHAEEGDRPVFEAHVSGSTEHLASSEDRGFATTE